MTPLPNAAETALAQAIRLCGQDGFETALWDFLQRATRADNVVMLGFPPDGAPVALYRQSAEARAFGLLDAVYLAGAYLLDPIHELHLSQAPAGLYRLSDVAPDAFHRSRYFEEYLRQTTIVDEIDFIARPTAGTTLALAVGRDATSGTSFAARDVEVCQRIAPIVISLAERHWASFLITRPFASVAKIAAPGMASALKAKTGIHLSARQVQVAMLILQGHSTVSIGLRLQVSPQTVKVFRRQLYARCAISSQAELFGLLLPVFTGGHEPASS